MLLFIFVIICISLDVFVLMMEKGATSLQVTLKKAFLHGFVFSVITSLLYILGCLFTKLIFTDSFVLFNKVLAIILLDIIAIRIIWKTRNSSPFEEKLDLSFNIKKNIHMAFFTGLDCFLIAIICSYLNSNFYIQSLFVFFITLATVVIGEYTGYYCGASYQKNVRYLSAFIYFIIAFILTGSLV